MLTYLLVAMGGAIGSVLRAWFNTAVVSVTGPAFPWGTILINVVGSTLIGFFATLTATDGRFGVATEWRTFVMVGLCGGFTTFSSFSLQTLELARDGRAGQALGNVALSLVLCLAGVSAGFALAMAVRTGMPMRTAGPAAGGVVVALQDPAAAPALLSAARRMVAEGEGPATVLAIDGPGLAAFQPTEEVMTRGRAEKSALWVGAMAGALDGWVRQQGDMGGDARWMAVRGDGAGAVAEHMRGARLLVLELHPEDDTARRRVHAALVRLRRPVLLLPSGADGPIGRVAAVAWSADGAAAAAVRAALPLLRGAERVVALGIGDEGEDGLVWALGGIAAEVQRTPAGGDAGRQLLAMAERAKADLLVMGAFGHGRVREVLFDGVTEHVLRHARLPVLMAHAAA